MASLSRGGHLAHVTVGEIRAELAGHDLMCWCPTSSPCHADVLLAIANQTVGAESGERRNT